MSAPTPNAELAYRVLDQIDANPQDWDQRSWACGTSYCFGGWAVLLGAGATVSYDTPRGAAGVIAGPDDLVGLDAEDAANEVLGLERAYIGDEDEIEWLYDPCNSREDLGRLVAEIFGPRPELVDEQAWRECAHRADYTSAAHHERECAYHRGEVDEDGLPVDDTPPNAGSAS